MVIIYVIIIKMIKQYYSLMIYCFQKLKLLLSCNILYFLLIVFEFELLNSLEDLIGY